jgi:DNA polymerase-3 subunit gamma/tau
MTSQTLYRKWRSQTFDEMVGQEPIVETLKNELKSGNLSHAYLFTGPRGTGKTTTARLLAKTVNCEHPRDGEPCNECQQCREITLGTSLNVIEIDAASNRGIDNIRELRERIMVPPANGKYKVYVLDEAHMLTPEASNALLKTLEEPPDYAIFVLATTDVHKMLPTVISRCQPFYFKRITTRRIVEHLLYIAGQEGITLNRSAAELIARAAAGGMRDALSLLDQAIAYAGSEISLAQVQSMLGVADPRAVSKFITSIADLDGSAVLHLVNELSEAGADLRQVNVQIMEYWRALMLTRAGANAAEILDLTADEMQEIKQLATRFALEELTEYARIFAQNELAQKSQGTPQLALELAALDCIDVHRRAQSGLPVRAAAPAYSQDSSAPPPQQATPGRSLPAQDAARREAPVRPQGSPLSSAAAQSGSQAVSDTTWPGEPERVASAAPVSGGRPALTVLQVSRAWENVRKRAKQKSALLATYLGFIDIVAVEGIQEQPVVVIRALKATHLKTLREANRNKDLEWALQVEFGLSTCQVRLLGPDQPHTIADSPQVYSTGAPPSPQASTSHDSPLMDESTAPSMSVTSPALTSDAEQVAGEAPATNPYAADPASSAATMGLARKNVIRENRQGTPEGKDTLEQKVRRDPVVQEVMRTFTAKIVEIHPK